MLSIAGQTTGPIFCEHSWVAEGCYKQKKNEFFFQNIFFKFFARATPGLSASSINNRF